MFQSVILLLISIIPSCLGLSEAVCPNGIGFLDLEDFYSNTPKNALYFYNRDESIGSSNRFIFPNLTVPCYVSVDSITLFQGLPFACIQARAEYELELWTAVPGKPGSYELVYAEFLSYVNTVSPQIFLYPNKDLIVYPGDVIGFRNSTLNFFNQYNMAQPLRTTSTYWGLIDPGTSCMTYSHLEFGKDVLYQGDWAPYFNFSLSPQTPEFTEFQIKNNSDHNESIQPLLLYHRGIYRPICNHLWHIRTADILCQMANFSHAEVAGTVPTLDSSSLTHLSGYYWLDYIYCRDYVVESQKCLRSSWECVTNCSTFNQSAAASCAMEEGRTRFVLRELEYNSSNFDPLFEFSPVFSTNKIPTIQIYYKQQWRNLSNISSQSTLEVICRSQGYTNVFFSSEAKTYSSFENGVQLDCSGSESHTSECKILEYSNTTSYLPILACYYKEGHVSLYNNHSHSRSRGEVQYSINSSSSSLAFVCTDNWSSIESSVVCDQLGYPTLNEYSLIPATLTDQSQYNYYMEIDNLRSIQADFQCSGYESSLRSCEVHTPLQPSNSTVCQKNIVSLSCATRQQIMSGEIDCYSYPEFLHPSLGYTFYTDNSSNCLSLYDVLPLSNDNNTQYTRVKNYFIQSIAFGRTISMYSNFIKLDTASGRTRRAVDISVEVCYVVYFDSNGTAVSVAGITNSSALTYSTLYNITRYLGKVKLTGNLTNLEEPVNTTSMSLICNRDGVNISSAYLLSSYSRSNPDAVNTPGLIGNFDSLQELQSAYNTVLTPPTTPTLTTNATASPTNQTRPSLQLQDLVLIYTLSSSGVLVLFFIIVSVFVCLLQLLRRHYKREIVTLQIQSKAVVSNVYSHEDMSTQMTTNPMNNYVQQNVYYYKLKLQSNTAMFVESTKSLRSTIRRVTMLPKFGVTTPMVNYVDVNSKRKSTSTDQWHVERDSLVYLRELGLGYYGKVQLMEAKNVYGHDKLPVAVKTLSTQDEVQTEQFMREVNLMMSVRNEYIVSLLGFCPPTKDATPLMVLEYMEFGDLKSLVRSYRDADSTRESELNILHLVSMAKDISSALVYLAEHFYIHRDIAARNCLVGKGLMCKLSDFGLALMTDGNGTSSLPRASSTIPIKWTAPETFTSGVFSFSSDVWSYGVFLWEIFTYGSEPLEEYTKEGLISAIKNGTLVLPHVPNVPAFCNDLIQMCCFFDPLQRPYIQDVRSIIEGVLVQNVDEDSRSVSSCQDDSSCLVESIM